MARTDMVFALGLLAAALAAPALGADDSRPTAAPPGTAATRYCMRIEAPTGSLIERIKCWTREQWADQGVDVEKEWAKEGVAVKG